MNSRNKLWNVTLRSAASQKTVISILVLHVAILMFPHKIFVYISSLPHSSYVLSLALPPMLMPVSCSVNQTVSGQATPHSLFLPVPNVFPWVCFCVFVICFYPSQYELNVAIEWLAFLLPIRCLQGYEFKSQPGDRLSCWCFSQSLP